MKQGDQVPLTIEGLVVGYAEVTDFPADGQVGLTIPSTYVIMGLATSLTSGPEPTPEVDVRLENGGRIEDAVHLDDVVPPKEQVVTAPTGQATVETPAQTPANEATVAPETPQTNAAAPTTQE